MYPPAWQTAAAAHVIDVSAALYSRRGLFASPPPFINTIFTIEDVQARYGAHFDRAMRMPAEAVSDLSDILRPRLPRRGLSPFCRTALALRYLGGGSYVDICAVFGVHAAKLSRSLWEVIDAINASPILDFDFKLACRRRRLDYAGGFQRRRASPFGNVIGALDGVAVRQEQPLSSDVQCVADYYSRKGFYAFNTQAICDADYKFKWMSCMSPGASHDSTAFTCTRLGQTLQDSSHELTAALIEDGHCIVADEAYAASEVLAVPWPSCGRGDQWKDGYNFYQSSGRIHIEQAFGMLSWRWGVFWRPLRVPFAKRPSLVRACFRLHNFCRGNENARDCVVAPWGNDLAGGDASLAPTDVIGANQRGRRRDCKRSDLRVRMTRRVEELDLMRPGVGSMF